MNDMNYGYGRTKESAALVRKALKDELSDVVKTYGLRVSVKKASSGYGGPRVEVTTSCIGLDRRYQYIVNSKDGKIGDGPGRLVESPCSSFTFGRPHYSARLVTPDATEKLNARIKDLLSKFGRDNDDAMTDYFDNTSPLFYGVEYEAAP